MTLYADSSFPVRDDLERVHAAHLASMAAPGTWGSGAQRLAVAVATRKAGIAAGLLESTEAPDPATGVVLPKAVLRVIERLAVSPALYEQSDCEEAIEAGLSDAEYAELVGLIARMCDLDVFARGLGVPLRLLPTEPARGSPSRQRPCTAVIEQAWIPTVPNPPAGGDDARALYNGEPRPYIIRSLSLVPDEFHAHREIEGVQYMPFDRVFDYEFRQHEGLTRPQCEIVAGRISVRNECFY